ncbi:hypothetical protein V8F20_001253 [Naviculisporaceae sp. PSN 640]
MARKLPSQAHVNHDPITSFTTAATGGLGEKLKCACAGTHSTCALCLVDINVGVFLVLLPRLLFGPVTWLSFIILTLPASYFFGPVLLPGHHHHALLSLLSDIVGPKDTPAVRSWLSKAAEYTLLFQAYIHRDDLKDNLVHFVTGTLTFLVKAATLIIAAMTSETAEQPAPDTIDVAWKNMKTSTGPGQEHKTVTQNPPPAVTLESLSDILSLKTSDGVSSHTKRKGSHPRSTIRPAHTKNRVPSPLDQHIGPIANFSLETKPQKAKTKSPMTGFGIENSPQNVKTGSQPGIGSQTWSWTGTPSVVYH